MSNHDQYPVSQITMTRAERQRLEAMQRRRKRKEGRETMAGKIVLIFLLLIASVFVFAIVRSKVTGEPPQLAGRQFYIVASGSMEPVITRGSLLVVRPADPAELKREDVITVIDPADPERVVSHRIMEVLAEGRSFITRGDANNVDDPEPVPAANVIGKAEYAIPYAGYILDFAQSTKGLIIMILIPSLLIVVFEFRKLMQYVAMLEEEKSSGSVS
jgi:signal peptidase